ncbi:MAG: hypothetical protein AAGM45_12795 [Cyanobacteria bacterium J06588_5]
MLLPSARTLKLTSARLTSARLLCGALIATGLVGVVSQSPSVAFAQTAEAAAPEMKNALTFKQLMDLGYAASAQGDFHTALINFRRALVLQPNQPYAIAAADNMAYYIEHARISARQREISQLESRLANATAQKDWVCAATTIDQLTMYTQPGSLNRERLIGQRGEVSGMLDARLNFDAWSTVCSAQRPVY